MSGVISPLAANAVRPMADRAIGDRRSSNTERRPLRVSAEAVRVGVIGYGYWGPNIVRNFHNVDNAELVAVCDVVEELARDAAAKLGGTPYTDHRELLQRSDLDGVVVVTATPVPQAAPQQPAAAPQQQQQPSGPPPGQVACAVATAPESQALSLLFAQLLTGANTAQQTAIRGAFAQVDRNNDGVVDAGICRDAVIQVTQALNALRPR